MKESSLSCRRLQPLDELIKLDGNNVQHGATYSQKAEPLVTEMSQYTRPREGSR